MCRSLDVPRPTVYYKPKPRQIDSFVEDMVIKVFKKNREVYGTRKLKKALSDLETPIKLSRRKIGKIMSKYGLISKYTLRRKKTKKAAINESNHPNTVNRTFTGWKPLEVVVSDLTYVKVSNRWHYICLLIDLYNREIIGHAAGIKKDATLVRQAFYHSNVDIRKIGIFHTDRGSEFKNEIVDGIMSAFGIDRSLSRREKPVDNAVSESMYHILKTEFVFQETFETLDQLELGLFQFVNWYNHERIHGSLGDMTPVAYREKIKSGS